MEVHCARQCHGLHYCLANLIHILLHVILHVSSPNVAGCLLGLFSARLSSSTQEPRDGSS